MNVFRGQVASSVLNLMSRILSLSRKAAAFLRYAGVPFRIDRSKVYP